jgi:hypothetical protein
MKRIDNVIVKTIVTSEGGSRDRFEMCIMINGNVVKWKASSIVPGHAAT